MPDQRGREVCVLVFGMDALSKPYCKLNGQVTDDVTWHSVKHLRIFESSYVANGARYSIRSKWPSVANHTMRIERSRDRLRHVTIYTGVKFLPLLTNNGSKIVNKDG